MEPEINSDISTKSNYLLPGVIILAGIVIAGFMYFFNNKTEVVKQVIKTADQSNVVNISNVKIENEPFIGNPNAPVTLAIWSDYQCPACKYGDKNLITPLVTEYVMAGKLKVVFKDFAFLGADSQTLALTARAIWEAFPNKYYEWHRVIFDNQGQENTGWATKKVISELTKKVIGIDQLIIDDLLVKNSSRYQQLIDADKNEGIKFGVDSTPSFIINDQLIAGVPQYNVVKSIIDNLLNN